MGGIAYLFFYIQNKVMKGGIRPTREVELQGVDIPEMGVLAYPSFYGSNPHVEMPDHDGLLIEIPEPVPSGQETSR
jgi:Amt family ammonium transporter